MTEQSVCIYCRGVGSSKEHVAPASLGGNCTIRCVCQNCNQALSTVDKALAEHSSVALSRIADTPPSAFATHLDSRTSFVTEDLGRVHVRVSNHMKTDVRPQCYLEGNHLRFVGMDRAALNELDQFVTNQIAKGKLAQTFIRIDADQRLPHFSMTRSNQAIVTAAKEEDARLLLRTIEADWRNIRAQFSTAKEQKMAYSDQPVMIEMAFKPNDELRGVAKIAFETLALLRGPEVALEERFNAIREYIRGEVKLPKVADGELAVDMRFVGSLIGDGHMQFTEQHAVLISSASDALVAHVTLYGRHLYVVKLASPDSGRRSLQMYEFSPTRDGHQELSELNIMKRLLQLGPEVFGFTKEQAQDIVEQLSSPSTQV